MTSQLRHLLPISLSGAYFLQCCLFPSVVPISLSVAFPSVLPISLSYGVAYFPQLWCCLFPSVMVLPISLSGAYFPQWCLFPSVLPFPQWCLSLSYGVAYFPQWCLFPSVLPFPQCCLFPSVMVLPISLSGAYFPQWCLFPSVVPISLSYGVTYIMLPILLSIYYFYCILGILKFFWTVQNDPSFSHN